MRKFVQTIFFIFIAAFIAFLVYNILFPFVYKIKEPFFEMPIEWGGKVETKDDLPIRNDAYGNGEFGAKRKGGRRHKGLDLAAEIKSPVRASKSGWARRYFIPSGYGNLIVIDHPGGWQTRYGHLGKCVINKFQWVRQGDIIGSIGKTGNADLGGIVPHVHFEIRHKGSPIDPAAELIKRRRGK